MNRKMKMRSNQHRRQQRSIYEILKDTDKPIGATHLDPKHEVYYKQDGDQWFYFENGWGESWEGIKVKVDLVKIGGCDESE